MINNILHLKYAVEVERSASISKAAENLYMGQPHLSKAIREFEESLGFAIFNRTSKGVIPTKKGKEFLNHAKKILVQLDEMDALYKPSSDARQKFDISIPRASYISFAFTEFIKELDLDKDMNINYRETNSVQAIKNVADNINNLAIARYQVIHERYFLNELEDRELKHESILEFEYLALMSNKHPLAENNAIDYSDLLRYTEIIHGDTSVFGLPIAEARQIAQADEKKKKIVLYDRGSQLELLSCVPSTYMLVSPMLQNVLLGFSLVQKQCNIPKNKYKDILVFRRGYHLSNEEALFIQKLRDTIEKGLKC
ncbi:MAG: LysR family transcriptional regulator [Alkaliphilus sp.]|nr:LysR family transcriptional regulator [Alkaliphilus sp.]